MTDNPQFTIKAILGVMLALSVPLAMIASGWDTLAGVGGLLFVLVAIGSVGYLLGRWQGVLPALFYAAILAVAFVKLSKLIRHFW